MKPWMRFGGILTVLILLSGTAAHSANTIRWSQLTYDTAEAAPQAQLLVIRDGDLSSEASVEFFTSPLSAKPGVDYIATNGTVRFPPNAASALITVDLLNDSQPDHTKKLTVILAKASPGWRLSGNLSLTLSIRDNDTGIQFAAYETTNTYHAEVRESDRQVSLPLKRSGDLMGEVWVDYEIKEITAKSGENFIGSSGRVYFGSNETYQSITIGIVNDTSTEGPSKQFEVILRGSTPGIAIGFTARALVTLLNDDTGPYAQLACSYCGFSESEPFVSVIVKRGLTPALGTARVGYRTLPGSAFPGEDYEPTEGILVFAPGEQTKTVRIPLIDDGMKEDPETFGFELVQLEGEIVIATSPPLEIKIMDDDAFPWSITRGDSWDEGTMGDLVFGVHRSGDLSIPQSISYRTVEITAKAGKDFDPIAGRLQFKAGEQDKTLTVAILDDEIVDGTVKFGLELFDPSDGALMTSETRAEIEVTDDEKRFEVEGTATEGEGSGVVSLHRGSDYSLPLVVHVEVSSKAHPAPGSGPVPLSEGDVVFHPGQKDASFAFPILDDGRLKVASYGTFQVRVSQISGPPALGLPLETQGYIQYKSFGFRLDTPFGFIPEIVREPGRVPFVISRKGGPLGSASVDYQFLSFEYPDPGVDFVPSQGTLYFSPGETSKTVYLEFLDNPLVDFSLPQYLQLRLSHALGDTPLYNRSGDPLSVEEYYQINLYSPQFDPIGHLRLDAPFAWKSPMLGALQGVAEQEGETTLALRRTSGLDQAESVEVLFEETVPEFSVFEYTQVLPATGGVDFEPSRQVIQFSPGQTSAPVRLMLHADREIEGFETLQVSLRWTNAANKMGSRIQNLMILDTSVAPLRIHALSERERAAIVPPANERMFSDGSRLSVVTDSGSEGRVRKVYRVKPSGEADETFVPVRLGWPGFGRFDQPGAADVTIAASFDQAWAMNLTAGEFAFSRLRRFTRTGNLDPSFDAVDLILGLSTKMELLHNSPFWPRSQIIPQASNEFILLEPKYVHGRYTPYGARITSGAQSLDVFPQDCRILETDGARRIGILRQGDLSQSVSYEWTYVNGTAIAGRDFQPGNGKVEFNVGQSTASIPFTALDNSTADLDRQLLLRFNRQGESQPAAEVELTLVNDDLGILDVSVVEPARLSTKLILAGHLLGDSRPLSSVHLFQSNDLKEWREVLIPWHATQDLDPTSPEVLVPFEGQQRFYRVEAR